jgi:nucleoside-diphosphate-sugar epimerase
MNLLVFGGSYFFGLAFTETAFRAGHTVTLLNRGNRPLGSEKIREFHLDRHDGDALAALPAEHFDAVVDFCGYGPGDISLVFERAGFTFDRYVFISTCDVYRRGTGQEMAEDGEFETRDFGGEAGAYILGKVALEQELVRCCSEVRPGVSRTVVRPAFLYGPGNYAPRESLYFEWIKSAGKILSLTDSDGVFYMVYVEDAARAVLLACETDEGDTAYNLCGASALTYGDFEAALEQAAGPFEKQLVTVTQVSEAGVPLPFPLTAAESERYDGTKIIEKGLSYTGLKTGLRETWRFVNGKTS